jgi:hypothetical protein
VELVNGVAEQAVTESGDLPDYLVALDRELAALAGLVDVAPARTEGGRCVPPNLAEPGQALQEAAAAALDIPTELAELATEYLSLAPEAIGLRHVSADGVVTYRRTAKHFTSLVAAQYGDTYTSQQARQAFRNEQNYLKLLEKQEWQRFFAQLRAMSDDELITYVAWRCRSEVDQLRRQVPGENSPAKFDSHLYQTRLKCAKQHMEWRGLRMPTKAKGAADWRISKAKRGRWVLRGPAGEAIWFTSAAAAGAALAEKRGRISQRPLVETPKPAQNLARDRVHRRGSPDRGPQAHPLPVQQVLL